MRIPIVLACAALLAGCATVPIAPATPAPALHAVDGKSGPEVDALAEAFFSSAIDESFVPRLQAVLDKYPDSGVAHLVAGYFSALRADDDASWEHFARASADRTNPYAELALRELALRSKTADELRATEELLRELVATHPNPEARALAAWDLGTIRHARGDVDDARKVSATLAMVTDVQLIGAFENDEGKGFTAIYPPEQSIDLKAEVPGKLVPVAWRHVPGTDSDGTLPISTFVSPSEQAVSYVVTWVHADAATPVDVRLTTPAPAVAWLNDAQVASDEHVRHAGLDNVIGHGELQAGWNKLLVKTAVKKHAWWLGVRLTDATGAPLAGLTYDSSSVHPSPKGTPGQAPHLAKPTTAAAAFAHARLLAMGGHLEAAQHQFAAMQSSRPDATTIRYFAAVNAEEHDQVERALDLLTPAIKGQTSPLPAFLVRRAGIYKQKQLRDQAEADLVKAIAAQPGSRSARLALAELYGARGWHHDREQVVRAALARWPDSTSLLVELADAREAQGYRGDAERIRQQALELEPGLTHTLRKLRDAAVVRRELDFAREDADRLHELVAFHLEDALERAEIERLSGHPEAADAVLAALIAQDPDFAKARLRRGLLAEERGDNVGAVKLLEAAQERNPDDAWLAERLDHLRPPQADATTPYVPTDEEIEAIALHPPASHDPAAQVQQLRIDEVLQINADGSSKEISTEIDRALTQQGRDGLLRFELGTAKNRVLKAYTLAPDGTRTEASSVTTTDVRFRSLEEGSVVVLQVVRYKPRMPALGNDYFSSFGFAGFGWSIEKARWVVLSAKGRTVNVEINPAITASASQSGDWDVRTFTREHVPALAYEPHMAPAEDVRPKVRLTTVPSWESFVAWEKAILLESFSEDPQIDALAAKLTAGAQTPEEKLEKLYAFVAQEIRYQIERESIIAGWQPHKSSVVLERKYGDCKDKATLLIALAKSVGIDLDFAVLATHALGHPDRSIAFPNFNHAIVYVPQQTGIASARFIDPTVDALDLGNLREDDQGQQSLVLDPRKGTWSFQDIPYQAPDHQKTTHRIDIDIEAADKIHAHDHMTVRGTSASEMRLALRSAKRGQQMFEGMTRWLFDRGTLLKGDAPDHEDFSKPLEIDLDIDASATVQKEGDHQRLKLPPLFPLADYVTLTKRDTPVDLHAPWEQSVELHAQVPQGMRLLDPPAPFELVRPCFKVKRTVSVDGRQLTLRDQLEKTCTEVTPAQYAAFREDVQKASAQLDAAVLFGAETPAPLKRTAKR